MIGVVFTTVSIARLKLNLRFLMLYGDGYGYWILIDGIMCGCTMHQNCRNAEAMATFCLNICITAECCAQYQAYSPFLIIPLQVTTKRNKLTKSYFRDEHSISIGLMWPNRISPIFAFFLIQRTEPHGIGTSTILDELYAKWQSHPSVSY